MIRKFMFLLLVLVGCGNGSRSSTGTPGALSCASSVETFCIDGHETQCSWSTELGAETCQVVTSCHGYLVAIEHGVDTGTYYYYDTTAGKLIAAIAYGVPGRLACAAGPSTGFVVPDCSAADFVGCVDAKRPCIEAADCGPNPAATCARTCPDGSNPCVFTCAVNQCIPRGCPGA